MSLLPEISESAATGTVAATYAEIRRVTGVPFVVFIYRALAAQAGRLETIWAELAPNLASPEGRAARAELEAALLPAACGTPGTLPAGALAAAGVEPLAVAATLTGFRRANAANVVGLWALLDGVTGRAPAPSGPVPGAADTVPPGLPMADLATLPASTVALLEQMSAPIAGDERPVLVPSLYRTFAHDEELLTALDVALRPMIESPGFRPAVTALAARGRELARSLPHPVTPLDDPATRTVIERFLRAIPAMILVGALIGEATGADAAPTAPDAR